MFVIISVTITAEPTADEFRHFAGDTGFRERLETYVAWDRLE